MKEQAYNEDRDQDYKSLTTKSNLIDLMKECHNELTSGEIVSLKILSRTMKSKPNPEPGPCKSPTRPSKGVIAVGKLAISVYSEVWASRFRQLAYTAADPDSLGLLNPEEQHREDDPREEKADLAPDLAVSSAVTTIYTFRPIL
ncbi:hypothetical protein Tco_0366383 [Tanacetum coccineum]